MSPLWTRPRYVCRATTSGGVIRCHLGMPSCHSYSVAPPAVAPSSDHAKRATYGCKKCAATFGRLDKLQRHASLVCSCRRRRSSSSISCSSSSSSRNTTVYTCKKCGRKFHVRCDLTRHARIACTDVNEPPSPKRSKRGKTSHSPTHSLPKKIPSIRPIDFPSSKLCQRYLYLENPAKK